jgi:MSHA biogenesis protein MshM
MCASIRTLSGVGCLIEAVRSAQRTIDIDIVNRVLMQPHWQKDTDLTDY